MNIRTIIQHYESVYDTHNTFCIEFSANVPLIYDAWQGSIYAVSRFLSPEGILLAPTLSHSAKPSGITAKIMFKNCTLWSLPQLTAQKKCVCKYLAIAKNRSDKTYFFKKIVCGGICDIFI